MQDAQLVYIAPQTAQNQKFVNQLRRSFTNVIHLSDQEIFDVLLHNSNFRFDLLITDSSLLSQSFANRLQNYKMRHADPLLICVGPFSAEIMHITLHYGFDEFFAALPGSKQLLNLLQQHQLKVNQ